MPQIRQRGSDRWEVIVDLGRGADGKRRQQSKTVRGTKLDALLFAERAEARAGVERSGDEISLVGLILASLDDDRDRLSPTTIAEYERIVEKELVEFGLTPVTQLTTPKIDAFYRSLQPRLAPASVRQVHALVSRGTKEAIRRGLTQFDPAQYAKKPTAPKVRKFVPTDEQVMALLDDENDEQVAGVVRLAMATGCRRGELLGFRWANYHNGTLQVEGTVVEARGRLVVKPNPKTASSNRKITLDPVSIAMLDQLRASHEKLWFELGTQMPETAFIGNGLDRPWIPSNFSKRWAKVRNRVDERITLRSLRDWHCSRLIEGRMAVTDVSQRMGHSSSQTTLTIYAHALHEVNWQGAAIIDSVMNVRNTTSH